MIKGGRLLSPQMSMWSIKDPDSIQAGLSGGHQFGYLIRAMEEMTWGLGRSNRRGSCSLCAGYHMIYQYCWQVEKRRECEDLGMGRALLPFSKLNKANTF